MSGLPDDYGRSMTTEEMERLKTTPLGEIMPWLWYADPNGVGPDLLLGRYPDYMQPIGVATFNDWHKVVYVETLGDRRYVEEALCKPVVVRGNVILLKQTIDQTNERPSTRPSSRSPVVVLYEPPVDGWPWILVLCMPFNIRAWTWAASGMPSMPSQPSTKLRAT